MDVIKIKNLEVYANHGVLSEENKLGQKFIISIKLFLNLNKATKTDNIDFSVSYSKVCKMVTKFMQENTFNLIESATNNLIYKIMDTYQLVDGVNIEVKKPWAPIKLPLKTVSVKMKRFRHTAYISLGSNLGDKEKYIHDAIDQLRSANGCIVEKISDMIITKPYGNTSQDDFLNGILKLKTILSPHELLNLINNIENKASRKRDVHWGPRTLDLDIIFYDDKIIDDQYLHIPHLDMHNREFVLKPLVQIAPFVRHPILNQTAKQLLENLKKSNN